MSKNFTFPLRWGSASTLADGNGLANCLTEKEQKNN